MLRLKLKISTYTHFKHKTNPNHQTYSKASSNAFLICFATFLNSSVCSSTSVTCTFTNTLLGLSPLPIPTLHIGHINLILNPITNTILMKHMSSLRQSINLCKRLQSNSSRSSVLFLYIYPLLFHSNN